MNSFCDFWSDERLKTNWRAAAAETTKKTCDNLVFTAVHGNNYKHVTNKLIE